MQTDREKGEVEWGTGIAANVPSPVSAHQIVRSIFPIRDRRTKKKALDKSGSTGSYRIFLKNDDELQIQSERLTPERRNYRVTVKKDGI
jgi:hypothetical protein